MRRTISLVSRMAGMLMIGLASACASSTTADPAAGTAAVTGSGSLINVLNNHSDGRDVVLYLVPEGRGERRNLGVVGTGESKSIPHEVERGYYTLVAGHNLGEEVSDRFSVPGPSIITWNTNSKRVTVRAR